MTMEERLKAIMAGLAILCFLHGMEIMKLAEIARMIGGDAE